MDVLTLVLFAATIVCAIGWIKNKLAALILAWHMNELNIPDMTDDDYRRCARLIVSQIIADLKRR